ncbi:class I SAM-dependent methyltransferase [Acidimicrobiaceae bacterium]|nr:class I SAM-dependent methyltransferase [Acidimicrobiaceae bacterium]
MTFEPQIPNWGNEYESYIEKLKHYHDWLCTTGIKTGLISRKSSQFIWDEFIVHSLYFGKILHNIENNEQNIYDLGTGGGIPGVPVAITNQNKLFILVDISESRVFELQRLKNILNLDNIQVFNGNADLVLKSNNIYISRCFISSQDVLKNLKQLENVTYIVSSNGEKLNEQKEMFHVKQEKFTINSTNMRHIDVINVR